MKYLKDLAEQMKVVGVKDEDNFYIIANEGAPAVVVVYHDGVVPQIFVQNENLDKLQKTVCPPSN